MICPNPEKCTLCHSPISPTVVDSPLLFIVGEAPGKDEELMKEFFVGKAGVELTNYLSRAGLARDRCYITNILKCRPPENRDPRAAEVECCTAILEQEIAEYRPRIIVAVGRFAARWFLGDVDMEMVHGIPFNWERGGVHAIVVPVYHPSAGLHDTTNMSVIMADFLAVRGVVKGNIEPRPVFEKGVYTEEDIPLNGGEYAAVDTETGEGDKLWSVQVCANGKDSRFIPEDKARSVCFGDGLVIVHNAMFDIPVMKQAGLVPANIRDTMVMAYLLQTEPQGLKPLAFRHLGLKMRSYDDMITEATQSKALVYLINASEIEWPKSEPVLEEMKGVKRLRQPQTINRKVKSLLNRYLKDDTINLLEGWNNMEGREMVEDVFGKLEPAHLSDIERGDAIDYACEDAYATFHLYPVLLKKIQDLGLEEVLDRDMGALQMASDMQENGILIDKSYFRNLREEFVTEMSSLREKIEEIIGYSINPGSDQQIFALLKKLGLAKGEMKRGSTNRAKLDSLSGKNKVIPMISEWKGYSKLISSFVDVLLEKTGKDGRIRTTLRTTRVVTGRLSSSKPNLMAQPVRTSEGRKIRGGFVASPGCSLVSLDYSQIEMRVVAHISQDPVMMGIFINGEDIHSATASKMFGLPVSELNEMLHRYPAKRVGFGILNLISPEALLRELILGGAMGWTVGKCAQMIVDWFGMYQGVAIWVEERKVEARRTGMVRDMFGRIRLVPELMSVHQQIREAGIRQAVNTPIQSGAQGIIKEAMRQLVPLYRDWDSSGLIVKPLLQIHDDLVWEIQDDILDWAIPAIKSVMESCVKLSVPIRADAKVGKTWLGMEKWGKKGG